jgi:Tol biopolymer transport system component
MLIKNRPAWMGLLLLSAVILAFSCKSGMNQRNRDKGITEWEKTILPETGREVWQITTDSSGSVACYFERQAFTGDDKYLVFSSRREGRWRLFRADLKTGIILPLSPPERNIDRDNYAVHPLGELACYLDGDVLYGTNVQTFEEMVLYDFSGKLSGRISFSGSFTSDGEYCLLSVSNEDFKQLYRVNLQSGEILLVHEQDTGTFSHPLINPADPDIITYVPGPDTQNDMSLPMEKRARTWKINLKKSLDQPFLTCPYGFRATHESWSFDGNRFFFFRKTVPGWMPVTICSINTDGVDLHEYITSDTIRLGHGIASRDGRWFISDSQDPGKNPLILVNLETGTSTVIGWPDASIEAGHSKFAHIHPFFSPTGKYVCYTSDHGGTPQVYVVPVGDLTNPD